MIKEKIVKENGKWIPLLRKVPENHKAIVIMVHGFTSSKSCQTAELLFRRLPKVGIGVVTYDQPGHGTEEALLDELSIDNCINSLKTVEEYVEKIYPKDKIYYFSSSFGAYITGLYISTNKHKGNKAFLRSAAVNMPQLILEPLKEAWCLDISKELEEYGYIRPDLGLGETIKIPKGFLKELRDNNLFEIFDNKKYGLTEIELVHGENDSVVDIKNTMEFKNRFGFTMNVIKGEGHSICDNLKSPDKVADLAIAFYNK